MSVIFTSKDISKKLKIGKSRVREISKELEKTDYQFTKNQETRIYSEKDLLLIQRVVEHYHISQNLTTSVQYVLNNLTHSFEPTSQIEQGSIEENQIITETFESSFITSENSTMEEFFTTESNIKLPIDETPPTLTVMAELTEESLEISQNLKVIDNKNLIVSPVENVQVKNELPVKSNLNVLFEEELPIKSEVNVLFEEEIPTKSEVNVSLEEVHPINTELNVLIENELPSIHDINILNEAPVITNVSMKWEDEQFKATESHGLPLNSEMNLIKDEFNSKTPKLEIQEKNDIDLPDHKLEIVDELSNNIVSASNQSQSNQVMFEEFMSQISSLADQNEQILQQNQTLIKQNLEKDQKLEKILYSVEEKSEELQELASVIEEKDEKLEQMFEDIQLKQVDRDAQLMRVIRELQETKKMVAASREKTWKLAIKSLFVKPKTVK
jgi:Protein of unknown function (DUF3967)